MSSLEGLTGRIRYRNGFRGKLIVQVELRKEYCYGLDSVDLVCIWRDAKIEDFANLTPNVSLADVRYPTAP